MRLPRWRLRTVMIAMAVMAVVGVGAVDLARLLERRTAYRQQADIHAALALQRFRGVDQFAEQAEMIRKWITDGAKDWPPYANTPEIADRWRKEPGRAEQAARWCDGQAEYYAALYRHELALKRKYLRAADRFWWKADPDSPPPEPPQERWPEF
jgi:hypothetical protein